MTPALTIRPAVPGDVSALAAIVFIVVAHSAASCARPPEHPAATAPATSAAVPEVGAPRSETDSWSALRVLVFGGPTGAEDEGIFVSSSEGAAMTAEVRVTWHGWSRDVLRRRMGTDDLDDHYVRLAVRNLVREAMTAAATDRPVVDIWGPKRSEWIAASLALSQKGQEDAGFLIDRLEVLALHVPPQIERAFQLGGVTPGS